MASAPVVSAARGPRLLAPADVLVVHLRNSARLALLVVLLLVPAAMANWAFASTVRGQIGFSSAERDGVVVLRPALASLAAAVSDAADLRLTALRTTVQAHPELGTATTWKAVDAAASAVALTSSTASGREAAAARATLASALVDLITQVGNTSNLILDPDLDSFYVMDALVVQVPRLLLTAAQAAAPDSSLPHTAQVAAQAVTAGTISGAATAVVSDVKTSTANTSLPDLASRLTTLSAVADAGQGLATKLAGSLDSPRAADPAPAAAAATRIDSAVTALDTLLQRRIGHLSSSRNVTLGVTLAALLLACWMAAAVWQRTRSDVGQVVAAVTAIANDDLEPRPVPAGRDEFGDIGRAVGVARERLARARSALSQAAVEREEQLQANFSQQRTAEKQSRQRAQNVIDETTSVVIAELGDVVHQVDAVRTAAATIDDRVGTADTAARDVVTQAKEADRLIVTLSGSLDQVQSMAKLIAGIADQTRLLALNATIEAARAGEAGRGFSVVAQEVKNLAVTTARSTGDITQTIATLQEHASAVASAITRMSSGISGVDDATAALGNVANEQYALVERLDRSVDETLGRLRDMASLTEKLERRQYERIPTVGEVSLWHGGRQFLARLADISKGGVQCSIDAAGAPRADDLVDVEIMLTDGLATLPARILRSRVIGASAQLGMEFDSPDGVIHRRLTAYVETLAPRFSVTPVTV